MWKASSEALKGFPNKIWVWTNPGKRGVIGSAIGLVPVVVGAEILYTYYAQKKKERNIRNAFFYGSFPSIGLDIYPRKDALGIIKALLQLPKEDPFYRMITGEHGVGKTTLVVQACNEVKNGVIYANLDETVGSAATDLASAIHYDFKENRGLIRIMYDKFAVIPAEKGLFFN